MVSNPAIQHTDPPVHLYYQAVTIELNFSTAEAARLMRGANARRLPVMKDKALVGIITSKDLLACVVLWRGKIFDASSWQQTQNLNSLTVKCLR